MRLSRAEAEAFLRKYTARDGPEVLGVLVGQSLSSARVFGRLSIVQEDGTQIVVVADSENAILFSLDSRCRFEYDGEPSCLEGPAWLVERTKKKMEGVLTIVNSSGDRLCICEPRNQLLQRAG
jgi:hypothetical protein